MLSIIIWYTSYPLLYHWPRPCPQSRGLGLGLEILASFNITDKQFAEIRKTRIRQSHLEKFDYNLKKNKLQCITHCSKVINAWVNVMYRR